MHLPAIFRDNEETRKRDIESIYAVNESIVDRGLSLSRKDISKILVVRKQALSTYGRLELSVETTSLMIEEFSESPYIAKEDFVETISDLQEIFYYFKNETEDRISDTEIIGILKRFYNTDCRGSIDYLRRKVDEYATNFRCGLGSRGLL